MRRFIVLNIAVAMLAAGTAGAHWGNAFTTVLKDYEKVRLALAAGRLDDVPRRAARIERELEHLRRNITAQHAGVPRGKAMELFPELPEMGKAAGRLRTAATLEDARAAFRDLSSGLVRWHGLLIKKRRAVVVRCTDDGTVWLQTRRHRKRIANPFTGDAGARCDRVLRNG